MSHNNEIPHNLRIARSFDGMVYPEVDTTYKRRGGRLFLPDVFVGEPLSEQYVYTKTWGAVGSEKLGYSDYTETETTEPDAYRARTWPETPPRDLTGYTSLRYKQYPGDARLRYETRKVEPRDTDIVECVHTRGWGEADWELIVRREEYRPNAIVIAEDISLQGLWLAIGAGTKRVGGNTRGSWASHGKELRAEFAAEYHERFGIDREALERMRRTLPEQRFTGFIAGYKGQGNAHSGSIIPVRKFGGTPGHVSAIDNGEMVSKEVPRDLGLTEVRGLDSDMQPGVSEDALAALAAKYAR